MTEVGFGCASSPGLTICAPRGNRFRAVRYCRACRRRTRFLVTWYVWYGPEVTCCSCTNHWSDGWLRRKSRSAKVRERQSRELYAEWVRTPTTQADAMRWLMAEVNATVGSEAA